MRHCPSGSSWLEEHHRGDCIGLTRLDDWNIMYSVGRDPVDLGQAGDPQTGLLQAGNPQGTHTLLLGDGGDLQRVRSLHDQLGDVVRHQHDLIDPDPSSVASRTLLAADRLEQSQTGGQLLLGKAKLQQLGFRHHLGRLAVIAQLAGEALGHDQGHRGGDVEGRYPHVHHPGQGLGRRVGVQGGEYQVTGLRRLDGDFGSSLLKLKFLVI